MKANVWIAEITHAEYATQMSTWTKVDSANQNAIYQTVITKKISAI